MAKTDFIKKIAPYVVKYAPKYDIQVCSPIIAQAILESGWGESKLASVYHNYFGMKCGSKWTGASVNLKTSEEYTPGTYTNITANFRAYDSMEAGVIGYFEFIQLARYANLKGVTDPEIYLKRIKNDGYATSSTYVDDVMKVVDRYQLRQYDPVGDSDPKATAPITEKDVTLIGHGSGRPAKHNMYTYNAQRYAKIASNGKHKGVVAVRRLKALKDAQRAEFVKTITTRIGENYYSQVRREYVYTPYKNGCYYSDCSSIGMATFKKLGFKFSWLYNTAAIYQEDEFEDVPVVIQKGHITNPEVLKVGDAVLYVGNDPSRPKQIGHVEWVYDTPADDKPTEKTAKHYSGTYPSLYNGRRGAQKQGYYQYGDGISTLKNYPTQIRRIQLLLNWADDSRKDLTVDGKFGSKTKSKVNTVRRAMGLKGTGVFDADLLDKLKAYTK